MPRIGESSARPIASRAKRARAQGRTSEELTRFGKLEPRHTYMPNPDRDARFTRCLIYDQPTKLRKFVFVIHKKD